MVIEKIKLRNVLIADLSVDKTHCRFFGEGNLQVIDVEDLRITSGL